MINYQSDVIINRPVEQAFKLAADVAHLDDWTDMTGTHLVSGGDLALGSEIQTTLKFGPMKQVMTFQVSEFDLQRRLGWKSVSKGALAWDALYLFEPQGTGATRVSTAGQLRLNGLLRLLEPLMAVEVQAGEAKELLRFKQLVEAAAA
ncbi:MAG: SRPBCC family protein [Anaerolineales bacterium]|nr:SRPBCC family protein [Anaerolineales bacterium]